MHKKRVLLVGESSLVPTGYGTMTYHFMKAFHESDKYDLLELSSYANIDDPKLRHLPWPAIGNAPPKDNASQDEVRAYESKTENQFGEHRFNDVCLDFMPDVVLNFEDYWYQEFIQRSPFRNFYSYIYQLTCDAKPQAHEWIQNAIDADTVLTYSHWAKDVILKQGGNKINFQGVGAAGVDTNIFNVKKSKQELKNKFGLRDDVILVGTTVRNQRRKLLPDLIHAFADFLKHAPEKLAQRTFLYLHTSYPDLGWHIPTLIKETGTGSKILFTYVCQNCNYALPSLFQDVRAACPKCNYPQFALPNCGYGVSPEFLAEIYRLFDVYVQFANSEGLGIPVIEAAACGIHPMVVNYSAMEDFVWKLGATPISVKSYARESETHCFRAVPDNDDFVKKLIDFISLPESIRINKGFAALQGVLRWYTWEKCAKVWMDAIDSVQTKPKERTWLSPAKIHQPPQQLPPLDWSIEEFVRWALVNVVGRPELVNTYFELRLIADLNMGLSSNSTGGIYFNELSTLGVKPNYRQFPREAAANDLLKLCEFYNTWEHKRHAVMKSKGLM